MFLLNVYKFVISGPKPIVELPLSATISLFTNKPVSAANVIFVINSVKSLSNTSVPSLDGKVTFILLFKLFGTINFISLLLSPLLKLIKLLPLIVPPILIES